MAAKPPNRTIRGIRESIPQGYLLGRMEKGEGPVHLVSMRDLQTIGASLGPVPVTYTFGDTAEVDLTLTGNAVTADLRNNSVVVGRMHFTTNHRIDGRSTASAGAGEELTIDTILDWIGAAQGSILFRDSATWNVLAPGTDTYVLTTHGAAANPTWEAPSGGGGTVTPEWDAENAWMSGFNLHPNGRTITELYTASQRTSIKAATSKSSGKFYFEFLVGIVSGTHFPIVGVGSATAALNNFVGSDAQGYGIGCSGLSWTNNATTGQNAYVAGDIMGFAIDFTAGTGSVKFFKNNVAQSAQYSSLTLATMFPQASFGGNNTNGKGTLRLASAEQTYTPPAGYSSWLP